MKRRIQRMESPKPEPLLVSTQKLARQARKFRRRARELPKGCRNRMMGPLLAGNKSPFHRRVSSPPPEVAE